MTRIPLFGLLVLVALLAGLATILHTSHYHLMTHDAPNIGGDLRGGNGPAKPLSGLKTHHPPMAGAGSSQDTSESSQSAETDCACADDSKFVSVFNITDSNGTTLLSAHLKVTMNVDAKSVSVTATDFVTNLTPGGKVSLLEVASGYNESYSLCTICSTDYLKPFAMPDNGSATIELQVSYYSEQNRNVVVVPFDNWTIALDFNYKCRMDPPTVYDVVDDEGNEGKNTLHSCLCRLGGDDGVVSLSIAGRGFKGDF